MISRFFEGVGPCRNNTNVPLGIGDDCALLEVPVGHQLAISIDTLVAGRHFPLDAAADDIAYRALAVSVSDLAAMGARPLAFTLAVTLPSIDTDWLAAFRRGLCKAADTYQMPLIGGDTTQGPLTITIQVHGSVAGGSVLTRAGAKVGDLICVSGTLGDAAAALACLGNQITADDKSREYLLSRFYQPDARIELGVALQGIANAAIDISDGLLADLQHITNASKVAATIYSQNLPLSHSVSSIVEDTKAIEYALAGGDDYELCFTVPADKYSEVLALSESLGLSVCQIGEIVEGQGVQCLNQEGEVITLENIGYQHFS